MSDACRAWRSLDAAAVASGCRFCSICDESSSDILELICYRENLYLVNNEWFFRFTNHAQLHYTTIHSCDIRKPDIRHARYPPIYADFWEGAIYCPILQIPILPYIPHLVQVLAHFSSVCYSTLVNITWRQTKRCHQPNIIFCRWICWKKLGFG